MRTPAFSTTSAKIFASVVLVGGAAGVAGLGTFGAFTDTTSASTSVSSGKVDIGLTQHATLGTTVAAADLVPGDTVQRAVTLTRSVDTEKFGSVLLTTSAGTTNVLSTDATKGLQLTVDECSVAWTKVGATNQLSCSGTTTNVVASRAVIGTNLDLARPPR
jgi:predicted ribosomally synthesized peptide with SipW-like signal peptide